MYIVETKILISIGLNGGFCSRKFLFWFDFEIDSY